MGDAHVLHRLRRRLVFNYFVVVSRDQAIERVAHEAEAEMAAPVLAGAAERDQFRFLIGFELPELVGGGFCPFGRTFAEQAAESCFDRGIRRLGDPPVEQVVTLHPDEVMRLSHGLRSLGEIFFEVLVSRVQFTAPELGVRIGRRFCSSLA